MHFAISNPLPILEVGKLNAMPHRSILPFIIEVLVVTIGFDELQEKFLPNIIIQFRKSLVNRDRWMIGFLTNDRTFAFINMIVIHTMTDY
jgi:hypothetical protein